MSSSPTVPPRPLIRLRSPADLLAILPYLLGFHPTDSLVAVGFAGPTLIFLTRIDLPEPASAESTESPQELLSHVADLIRRQGADHAVVIGYGELDAVDPLLCSASDVFARYGLPVGDVLRVTGARYWSYLCADTACCPPEGVPFEVESSAVAATATVAGLVALPNRQALESVVAPVTGEARAAMRRATRRAVIRLDARLSGPDPETTRRALVAEGRRLLSEVINQYREDGQLPGDQTVAWLSVLLFFTEVRDEAWYQLDPAMLETDIALWTDLTRRIQPHLVAPAASVLGYLAWRAGRGSLASVAIQRALQADPEYQLALLISNALRYGIQADPAVLDAWDETRPAPHEVRIDDGSSTQLPLKSALSPFPEPLARPDPIADQRTGLDDASVDWDGFSNTDVNTDTARARIPRQRTDGDTHESKGSAGI